MTEPNIAGQPSLHYRSCSICEAICGLEIEVRDGQVAAIRGDKKDPLSKGHICPKALGMKDIYEDPDRLKRPIRKRADGTWEEIGWDEALGFAADGLRKIREVHGAEALATYLGNPTVHNLGTILFRKALTRAMGSTRLYTATSVDQLPHYYASAFMLGHPHLLPVADLERTKHFLILGANPSASNGSMMTAPGMDARLDEIRARGGKVVLVDPRRTETARHVDAHHFIRPGTDVFLLGAMLTTIFEENLAAPGKMAALAKGWDVLRAAVAPITPERAELETGIPAETVRGLAREFAGAECAAAYGRMGVSVQPHGGLCQWLIYALNMVTGNFDRPGGAMFAAPAFETVRHQNKQSAFNRWQSAVRGLPELDGELPVAALSEDMTSEAAPIRGLVTIAGNPVLSAPNGRRLDRALDGLDFMVAIDIYLNETTRHADVILPPATGLEVSHYNVAFFNLSVRNTVKYSAPVFGIGPDQRFDYEILQRLGALLSEEPANEIATPEALLAAALAAGPYGPDHVENPEDAITLDRLIAEPHGIDLGPLREALPARLRTDDKLVDLAPILFVDRLAEVLSQAPMPVETNTFRLIGRRNIRDNNSWLHNSPRLTKGKNRCTAILNEGDADRLGLKPGDPVRVRSRVGEIVLPAEPTPDIAPGVVSIPHGYGHGRPGTRLSVAAEHAGASVNDITDDQAIDDLTGNAALSGLPVSLEPAHRGGT